MTPHDAVAELLGAYALDALEPDEMAMVTAHLATCPRCAAEVDEYRSVAALLANAGGDAPQGLWDRISSELQAPTTTAPDLPPRLVPDLARHARRVEDSAADGTAPAADGAAASARGSAPAAGSAASGAGGIASDDDRPPLAPGAAGLAPGGSGAEGRLSDGAGSDANPPERRRSGGASPGGAPAGGGPAARRARQRWQRMALAAVAGAAAVVIALLAVQVGQLDGRVSTLNALASHQNMPALAEQALADPQAQHVALVDASLPSRTLADLVILPDGTAYLVESSLPALPPTETYQLWGVIDGQAISLGLLGPRPGVEAFTFDASAPLRKFAVTAEPAGGVVMSTSAPVAAGTVHGE